MAVKFVEIIPDSGAQGTQIINFADAPEGISFVREHERPTAARRTQNGTLITQTIRYNKKTITLTIGVHKIDIHSYLQTLYESGIGVTLKLWYETTDGNFTETTEFNASASFIDYSENMDQAGNVRSMTALFKET